MKIVITSGPMEMPIDEVRTIKNSSTGSLGQIIANSAYQRGYDVTYICSEAALRPNKNINQIIISTHKQLLASLRNCISDQTIVIHAMAISDFSARGTINIENLSAQIFASKDIITNADEITNLIIDNIENSSKISSKDDTLVYLEKQIKIIDEIKKINPSCILFGFKLLSDVSVEELLEVATKLKVKSNCDYVIANRKEDINEELHIGYIIGDQVSQATTKEQIANQILNIIGEL